MKTAENIKHVRLNVRVTGELAAYVEAQTSPEGLYEGQSDLVRAALRLHRENKNKEDMLFHHELDKGKKSLDNGDYIEFNSPEEMKEHFANQREEWLKEWRKKN